MNAKEQAEKEMLYWKRRYKEHMEESKKIIEGVQKLPEELQILEVTGISWLNWDNRIRITYKNPDYFKNLKMAGVVGLKQVFYGKYTNVDTDWRWEDGKLEADGQLFEFVITESHRPSGCRIEREFVTQTVERIKAICPESGEER